MVMNHNGSYGMYILYSRIDLVILIVMKVPCLGFTVIMNDGELIL